MKKLFIIPRVYKHFFINFYQKPIYRDLNDRKGECKRCGFCCETGKCPLLSYDKEGKASCKLHNTPAYPWQCVIAPLRMDIISQKMSKSCGFYYENYFRKSLWEKIKYWITKYTP